MSSNKQADVPPSRETRQICPGVARLHVLGWQPGAFLSGEWWDELDLAAWRIDYHSAASCRRAIDRLIVKRRGFPSGPLPAALSVSQRRLLELETRLPGLLAAMGFYALGQPRLLHMRSVREELAVVLDEQALNQLAILTPQRTVSEPFSVFSGMCGLLLGLGTSWMQRDHGACAAWQSLAIRFPPPAAHASLPPDTDGAEALFRLSRFL
ncbi:type III secretion system domain-containing protein [Cupriavidus pampae]|uniref:Uncharacterized protein n=1 Tax=Cupriavidus pampae TaxID=659251 RepID=A0ABM8XZM0_9BURK|nr:type III secretion system domain-containing protein [Cupriavidus pampae]CAG9185912.1 hypothetical protein LMG32289_06157 [Cupriavidus pampae]